MRNQRGQALIEFLLIVPILLIMVMAVFDFGNILYHRYQVENQLDFIAGLYEDNNEEELAEYLDENNLVMEIDASMSYTVLRIKKEVSIYTPGLNKIIGDPYKITTTKTIYESAYE